MKHCKAIGCNTQLSPHHTSIYCSKCFDTVSHGEATSQERSALIEGLEEEVPHADRDTGTDCDHYLVRVPDPKRLDPYTAECEDIIEALDMSFQEGEAFKALWRKCTDRLGYGKPGDNALRNAVKIAHYSDRMVAMEQRRLP